MSVHLIGKKLGMMQLFIENGNVMPVTVIEAGPCPVTQVKTAEQDKYEAIQIGFMDKKERGVTKPLQGHFKKAAVKPKRYLKESHVENASDYSVGQILNVDIFEKGDFVDVIGTSKGKGFAGVVKRWGFHGGKASHGSTTHRAPGSIGASATPARVFKGRKMPGHMGSVKCTVQNLQVMDVRAEQNQLLIKGAIPGADNSMVLIRKAKKKLKKR